MTAQTTQRISYFIKDAAEATGYSPDFIRRAIKTTNVDPAKGVHHLPAKRDPNGKYVIKVAAVDTWLDQMDDA